MTNARPDQINNMIDKLLHVGELGARLTVSVQPAELQMICERAKAIFLQETTLVEVEAPITVVGDVHGQYSDLLRIFKRKGFPHNHSYVFLGDYVDRGQQSIETAALLFCYKIKYPKTFYMLRGNHETKMINGAYGFQQECERRYPGSGLWQSFNDAFAQMPFCVLISKRILGMHGGLSPDLRTLDQLRNLQRGVDPANPSLELDLLWSDPDYYLQGWNPSPRGASSTFGADVVTKACERLEIDLVVRAHQVIQDGYEFFANRRLVTIFSAPHYTAQFNNDAATMTVDKELCISFDTFHPI